MRIKRILSGEIKITRKFRTKMKHRRINQAFQKLKMKDYDKEVIAIFKQSIIEGIDTLKKGGALYILFFLAFLGFLWEKDLSSSTINLLITSGIILSLIFSMTMLAIAYGIIQSILTLRNYLKQIKSKDRLFEKFINRWTSVLSVTSVLFIYLVVVCILLLIKVL